MTETATFVRQPRRLAAMAAGIAGLLFVAALLLWGYYGTAVFTEMILAGLAACF
jgi:hypothetical protein